jgi:hypothetical protein
MKLSAPMCDALRAALNSGRLLRLGMNGGYYRHNTVYPACFGPTMRRLITAGLMAHKPSGMESIAELTELGTLVAKEVVQPGDGPMEINKPSS